MHEQKINIHSGNVILAGTLCLPNVTGQFPVVLLVHGSGPLDRDGNMKRQKLNLFNTIAHVLAANGIASLRYDKRGCGKSSGAFISTGYSDFVEDAVQWLNTLALSKYLLANQLYILGHSEGCIIAAQAAQRCPSVAGLILLCPYIENVESILIRQAKQIEKELHSLKGLAGIFYKLLFTLFGKPTQMQQRLISSAFKTTLPVMRVGFSRYPAKWLREILALKPEAIYALTQQPVFLVAGTKDMQCNPQDIFLIAKTVKGQADTLMLDDMTHLLRRDKTATDVKSTLSTAAHLLSSARLLKQPVDNELLEKIVQWLVAKAHKPNN